MVSFFTNYEGDGQFSMLRYADELETSLRLYSGSMFELHRHAPRHNGKSASRTVSRLKKYFEYPYLARRYSGQINHITDHGNSHVIRFLPADRTIITCHDLIPLRLADRLTGSSKRIKYSFWAKVVHMRKAAAVLADSESTRRDVITFLGLPAENVHVVHLGLNHERFRPLQHFESKEGLRRKLGFSWPVTLLHVGAPAFYKNLEAVIDVVAVLRQLYHLDVHLVRSGSPLPEGLHQLIRRRGIGTFVHDIKVTNDSELRELYLASDVLLFPSLWEGFGWPPLEALACGLPVVSSDRGSLPEVTGSAALQIDPEDLQGMVEAVREIIGDERLGEHLRAAGLLHASNFQWQKTAAQTAQVYRAVWEKTRGDSYS